MVIVFMVKHFNTQRIEVNPFSGLMKNRGMPLVKQIQNMVSRVNLGIGQSPIITNQKQLDSPI
jgi:hypothetical protein